MPPPAQSSSYDANYAQELMDDVLDKGPSALERARRGSIFLGAVFFATATFSAFPIPQSWPMATGLGGWIGDGVYLNLKAALDHFSIPISGLIVAGLTFIAGGFCLARYFGIVGRHVMDIWDAAGLVWATLRVWMDGLVNWLRVKFAKTYEADLADDSSIERLMRNAPDETAVTPQPAAYAPIATAPAPSYAPPSPAPVEPKAKKKPVTKKRKPKKEVFNFPDGADFVLPGLDLLKMPPPRQAITDEASLRKSAETLHRVMSEYGIKGEMGSVRPGPVVTLFEFEPLAPVVTEPKKAVVALKWTVREMEDRYKKMSKMGVRNMANYNEKVAEFKARGEVMTNTKMTGYDKETGEPVFHTEELNYEPMPYIVVIIDEMADLMMVAGKDIEGAVQRLAQMARAAGRKSTRHTKLSRSDYRRPGRGSCLRRGGQWRCRDLSL